MSVSSEVSRISAAKAAIASAIAAKGVSVPAGTRLDGMAALVAQIPVMTEQEAFLAAHPVGSIYRSTDLSGPSKHGGTWEQVPSMGAGTWERTA